MATNIRLKSLVLMNGAAMVGARAHSAFFADEGWDIQQISDGKYSVRHLDANEPTFVRTGECTTTILHAHDDKLPVKT